MIVCLDVREPGQVLALGFDVHREGLRIRLAGVLGTDDTFLGGAARLVSAGFGKIGTVLEIDGLAANLDRACALVGVRIKAEVRIGDRHAGRCRRIFRGRHADIGKGRDDLVGLCLAGHFELVCKNCHAAARFRSAV